MQREAMIDLLALECFERVTDASRGVWLLSILRDGFVGFANMTDAQLEAEWIRRGIGKEGHWESVDPADAHDCEAESEMEIIMTIGNRCRQAAE